MVDAISAEDIGMFSDNNIAEALQRVPGVQVERDMGEGFRISIRGLGGTLDLQTNRPVDFAEKRDSDWYFSGAGRVGYNDLVDDLATRVSLFVPGSGRCLQA